jgi:hypothetical protein
VRAEGNRGEFDQYKGGGKANDRPAYLQFCAEDNLSASRKYDLASEPPHDRINLY